MNQNDKKTVGAVALDLMSQPQENKDSIAQTEAMLSGFEKGFLYAVERGKAHFYGDFYIVVITKKERLMDKVMRLAFLERETCPRPEYDQTVYKVYRKEDKIEILWTVPDMQACKMFRDNPIDVPLDHQALLRCVLDFYDGTLERKCHELNGKIKETTINRSFNPNDFKYQENLVLQTKDKTILMRDD